MIPLLDLQRQYAQIRVPIETAVQRVLAGGRYVLGEEVAAFETEFAAACQARHGIAVNSGTSALHLALLAAGIQPGDEVMTVPFTFVATVAAIHYTGARPVFVDIEPGSYTMDARQIEARLTPRTRAIIPVHLYGQPADLEPILNVARRHRLVVIEDACQAHLAEYRGRRVGGWGDLGCFSFYPGKNLGACGEGGMVVTHQPEYARTIRMLRDWGGEKKYEHKLKGFNYRMEALQGAILREKLRHLEDWTERRRGVAARYDEALGRLGLPVPQARPGCRPVCHIYPIRVKRRAAMQQILLEQGVQTGIHYPTPVHLLEAYQDLGGRPGDFPVAEQAAQEELSLPIYPELTSEEIHHVVQALSLALNQTAH